MPDVTHIDLLSELLMSLVEKSSYAELGPADGRLYMQLCDTLKVYAEYVEETFNEGNDNTDEGTSDDTGPAGNQPPSPG